jgi:hypothetical protein
VDALMDYSERLVRHGINAMPLIIEEVDAEDLRTLAIDESLTPKQIMDEVHAAGGLFIYDHPNWQPRPDYTTDALLDTMTGLCGRNGIQVRMKATELRESRRRKGNGRSAWNNQVPLQ